MSADNSETDPASEVPEPTDKFTKFLKHEWTQAFVLAAGLSYALVVLVVAFGFPEWLPDRSEAAPPAGQVNEQSRADHEVSARGTLALIAASSISGLRWALWVAGVVLIAAVVLLWWPTLIGQLVAAVVATGKWFRKLSWANCVALVLVVVGVVAVVVIEEVGAEKIVGEETGKFVKLAVLVFVFGWGLRHMVVNRANFRALLGSLGSWLWASFLPGTLLGDLFDWFWVRRWVERLEEALGWVFASPLFTLQIVLFWAISWIDFGAGLGIPNLVWGDTFWMRLWVGVSISLLFANAMFVRATLDRLPGGRPPFDTDRWSLFGFAQPTFGFPVDDQAVREIGAFLARTWLPALAIFYLPVWRRDWMTPGDGVPGMMLLGLVLGIVITVLLVARYEQAWRNWWLTNKFFLTLPGFSRPNVIPAAQLPAERPVHALATVFAIPAVGFAVVFLFEYQTANAVWSPVWVACLLFGLFNVAYGFVSFHFEGLKYILLLLILLVLLVANTNHPYKMRHPGLDMYAGVKLDEPPEKAPDWRIQTPDLLKSFRTKWPGPAGKREGKPKLVIVCTTGGGIQAAVWTSVVLEGLEKAIPGDAAKGEAPLRDHIRLMTGASGGMQGAALYAADFHNFSERQSKGQPPRQTPLRTQLARDSLWPTLQTMLMHDLTGSAVPWRFDNDRGRRLERSWSWNCREWTDGKKQVEPPDAIDKLRLGTTYTGTEPPPLERTFSELLKEEKGCQCPSLVFSPMLVEDCRRVLISNLAVDWFTTARAEHLNGELSGKPAWIDENTISVPAIEFWRYFPKAHKEFQVGTAARMSASFPFVGPAVSLPTNPPRRVVDAGYFDNFGINFAALWLHRYRDEIREHTGGVVIIEIRAYPRRHEKVQFTLNDSKTGKPIVDTVNWAVSEGSSPLEGVYNLYARSAYFRNDQVLQVLSDEFNKPPKGQPAPTVPFFTTVLFECNQPAALSWTLPEKEAENIQKQFADKDWWKEPLEAPAPGRKQFATEKGNLDDKVYQQVVGLKAWFGNGGTK